MQDNWDSNVVTFPPPPTYRCTKGHEWTVEPCSVAPMFLMIEGTWCQLCLEEKLTPLLEKLGVGKVV